MTDFLTTRPWGWALLLLAFLAVNVRLARWYMDRPLTSDDLLYGELDEALDEMERDRRVALLVASRLEALDARTAADEAAEQANDEREFRRKIEQWLGEQETSS